MTDEQAVAKGHAAERELNETREAFAKVKEAAITALIATSTGQEAKRERLIVTCQILDAVQAALLDVVSTGAVAAHAIAQRDLLRV